MSPNTLTVPDLARRIERARFARAHHLASDPADIEDMEQALIHNAPFHPLALNLRAFEALPETALPAPAMSLTGVATLFTEARFKDALTQAHALDASVMNTHEQARLFTTIGDLECLVGSVEQAEALFRKAMMTIGPIPPLHARLGRCALIRGDADTARSRSIRALVDNPIYGTALILYMEACRSKAIDLLPIPVQAGLVRTQNGWIAAPGISPKAVRAWTAWAEARSVCTLEEVPPERTATLALIHAWRAGTDDDLEYTDMPSPNLETLDRMERTGTLDGYLWFAGLDPTNASQWRTWIRDHRDIMERFWFEGLVQP